MEGLERELKLLKIYAVLMTVALGLVVLMGFARPQANASFTEIDVELHAVLDQVLIEGDPSADVDVEANIEVAGPML